MVKPRPLDSIEYGVHFGQPPTLGIQWAVPALTIGVPFGLPCCELTNLDPYSIESNESIESIESMESIESIESIDSIGGGRGATFN